MAAEGLATRTAAYAPAVSASSSGHQHGSCSFIPSNGEDRCRLRARVRATEPMSLKQKWLSWGPELMARRMLTKQFRCFHLEVNHEKENAPSAKQRDSSDTFTASLTEGCRCKSY